MQDKPLIFFDPYPRNEEMVFTNDVKTELEKISNLIYHFGSRAPDELVDKNIEEIEILVGQTAMPKERLDKSKKIKAIINVKANWEPNIDYHEAHRRGIYVLSAAPAMAPAVAEACIGYAISLSRNVLGVYKKFLNSEEQYGIKENKFAYTLFDSNVGFIGFGNLAKSLLPLLKPFNCNILVNDIEDKQLLIKPHQAKQVSKEEIFKECQFITLHLPLTKHTEYLINKNTLKSMRNEAFLINTARGTLIDQKALKEALLNQEIAGAALEVYEIEPPVDKEFLSLPQLITTPHIGGNSVEAQLNMRRRANKHLIEHFKVS